MIGLAFILMGTLAAGGAPQAEPPKEVRTGSRLPRPTYDENDSLAQPEVRKVEDKFGQCVVQRHRDAAARFVLEQSEDARKSLIPMIADGDCLVLATPQAGPGAVQMKLTGDFMKYALADALVRQQFGSRAIADVAQVAPLVHEQPDLTKYEPKPGKTLKPKQLAELEQKKFQAAAYAYLAEYGECVVRADPAASYALLMTKPETTWETAAIGPLQPALQKCLDAGSTITLNKGSLRGTIAYNYYRLAVAPRATGTVK